MSDPRPVAFGALFRAPKTEKIVVPVVQPQTDWEQKHQEAEAEANQKLADAEARHQEAIEQLQAEVEVQRQLAQEAVKALDKAFSDAVGKLVSEATAKILNSTPPISSETLTSLVDEVLQALPEGEMAVLHHSPSIDPAILTDLPGVTLQPDPLLSETQLKASIGVGTISTSLAERIEKLCAELLQS